MERRGQQESNHEERVKVIAIEAFVVVAAAMLFSQIIFGSLRKLGISVIQGVLWVSYTLLFPLITHTFGMMQSSPVKSALYPVFATLLFLIVGGTNSITAYNLDDNIRWRRHVFEVLQYVVYMSLIFQRISPMSVWHLFHTTAITTVQPILIPCLILYYLAIITNVLGVIARWIVNYSDPSKVVADYMSSEVKKSRDGVEGCKYLVYWPGYVASCPKFPTYRTELPKKGVITIETVWKECEKGSFNSYGDDTKVKDVCLSFALSHLLKRRFFGLECAEADHLQTRKFVLEGLLSEEGDGQDDHERAFRIIEVELGFLYDFFYTRYATVFESERSFVFTVVSKIICTSILGVCLILKAPIIQISNTEIKEEVRTVDIMITMGVIVVVVVGEILQLVLYLGSNWAILSLVCHKVMPSFFYKHVRFLSKCKSPRSWQNKIGQFSIIEKVQLLSYDMWYNKLLHRFNYLPIMCYVKLCLAVSQYLCGCVSVRPGELHELVKSEIVSYLKSRGSHRLITNGEVSLERNQAARLSWTLKDRDQIEIMLIWHIATGYCKIAVLDEAENKKAPSKYQDVAISLSQYCAYLIYYNPELLPGNSVHTQGIFNGVVAEAEQALGYRKLTKDILPKAITDSKLPENSIFMNGLKLGKDLEGIDNTVRWKLMAEFWVETILYIAPSDNVKGHMELLAKGGEFLTHVWVLLTHAGILTRKKSQSSEETHEELA